MKSQLPADPGQAGVFSCAAIATSEVPSVAFDGQAHFVSQSQGILRCAAHRDIVNDALDGLFAFGSGQMGRFVRRRKLHRHVYAIAAVIIIALDDRLDEVEWHAKPVYDCRANPNVYCALSCVIALGGRYLAQTFGRSVPVHEFSCGRRVQMVLNTAEVWR